MQSVPSSTPLGLCHCGCGQKTTVAVQTRNGRIKGQPARFVMGHNRAAECGITARPVGYRQLTNKGYYEVKQPDHPYASKRGYVLEQRLVMEKMLGRYLAPAEVVHHKDDDPTNNNPDNLQLFATNAEHMRFHAAERRRLGIWSKHYPCCVVCGTTDRLHNGFGYCHVCYKQVVRAGIVVPKPRGIVYKRHAKAFPRIKDRLIN